MGMNMKPQLPHIGCVYSPTVCLRISTYFQNQGEQVWWLLGDGWYICPSTAYECCLPSNMSLIWIWEPFLVNTKPQLLHIGRIYSLAVSQDFNLFPQPRQRNSEAMGWWWIHMPIRSIWMLLSILDKSDMDVRTLLVGMKPQLPD